jgi:class 3 adenylate cyclase
MAAAGLRTPRCDHAIAMARFALKCRSQTRSMLHELGDSLGKETRNLRIRFGLHSGSVTGGVLRGEKARFQLFGDTVNTAS